LAGVDAQTLNMHHHFFDVTHGKGAGATPRSEAFGRELESYLVEQYSVDVEASSDSDLLLGLHEEPQ
jgi:hypothetical protein